VHHATVAGDLGLHGMTTLTLGRAARMTGVGKTTISRAIKAGKLSATRHDNGSYEIDPAELSRVYEIDPETPGTVAATRQAVRHATPAVTPDVATQAELTGARQLIEMLKSQVDDLRGDRDGWRQQAEAAQRLLTQTAPTARSPWWWRKAG